MTTDDKSSETQTQGARRKGGADGKAKDPVPKSRPAQAGPDASASPGADETGLKSRKITTPRR